MSGTVQHSKQDASMRRRIKATHPSADVKEVDSQ
jgi:hypothetical protein